MNSTINEAIEKSTFRILILYEVFIFTVFAITGKVLFFAVLALLPLVFLLLVPSKINWVYLLLFYICFFPTASWGSRYEFFVHHVYPPVMIGLTAVIFFFWYFEFLDNPYRLLRSNMDRLILALWIWIIFSMFTGLTKDYSNSFLFREAVYLSLYLTYFIFRDIFRNVKYVKYITVFFVIVTFLVSIQYILLFFSEANIISLIFKRVVTQQTHIILIGYFILLNIIIFHKGIWYRYGALIGTFPHILAMFFSQQRALWGAAVIGTFALIFINGKRNFSKKTWIYLWIGFGSIITALIFLLIYVEELVGGSLIYTAFRRIEFIFNLQFDVSLNARIAEIKVALKQWEAYPIWGTGLGSSITRFAKMGISNIVDNSFANYLWKMGIVGLAIYIGILLSFFAMGIKTLKTSENILEKNFVTTLLVAFGSLLIVALTNSSVFIYRFNIIWAMIFAVVHRYYDQYTGPDNEHLHNR